MKSKLFIFVILFLSIINLKAEKTYLIGKVPNYSTLDKKIYMSKSMQVSYFNIIWQEENESGLINDDGTFKIIFDLPFTQDIYIKTGTTVYIAYLASPGETIELNLNYQLTNQKYQGLPSPFYLPTFENAFVGQSKIKQDNFYKFYYEWIIKERVADQIVAENDNFQEQIELIKTKMDSYFTNIHEQNELYEWGFSHLFYSILATNIDNGKNIDLKNLQYPKSNNIISRDFFYGLNSIGYSANSTFFIDYGQILFDKLKEAVLSDKSINLTDTEINLIQTVNSESELSEKDSIQMRKLNRKIGKSGFMAEFQDSIFFYYKTQHLANELPPDFRDILIAQEIVDNLYPQKRCEYIHSKLIKDFTISLIDKREKKPTLDINDYLFPENKLISGIIKNNKGKAIYIDIWATWCGACRTEFPRYKEIINQYGDKVKFVFLCVSSPEKTYLDVLNSLDFNAEHYFVSAEQYEELKANYEVSSLPHYAFIKPDGTVINKTFRPSETTSLHKMFDEVK
jgi:thiol-disulfide isomerase/thioredoxin